MFNISCESYEEVEGALGPLLTKLEKIKSIQIQDKVYSIEYRLGGDLKMLAILYPVKKVEKNPTFWMCKINYDIGALQHDMLPKQNRLIKAKNIR